MSGSSIAGRPDTVEIVGGGLDAVPRPRPLDRLEMLCDRGTLRTIRSGVAAKLPSPRVEAGDGIVGGFGRVDGRRVACYAQDGGQLAGALGAAHAGTIQRVMDVALESRIPVVSFIESGGARLQEGTAALAGYGGVFRRNVSLSRLVPQVSVISGFSAGGGCYSPALTDFVVMTDDSAMFLTGPAVVRKATGEETTAMDLGGHRVHARNGVCDLVADTDASAARLVRRLLSYLPSHFGDELPCTPSVGPPLEDPGNVVPESPRAVYDVRTVIDGVVDSESFFEVQGQWARNVVTGFARLDGRPIGIVANQPRHTGGVLDVAGSQKAARFVEQCDTFGIPLAVFVDTPGFMPGRKQEQAGVIRFGASLVRAFARAAVPRITVIVRKAYGGAYIAMNSKELGASLVFAWPNAEIGIMSGHSAVEILNRRELTAMPDPTAHHASLAEAYQREHLSAERAAADGFVDEVIAPAETRASLIWGFSTLVKDYGPLGVS